MIGIRIGIDFDGTVFNSSRLKELLKQEFDEFESTYLKARKDSLYLFKEHCEMMGVEPEKYLEKVGEFSEDLLLPNVDRISEIDGEKVIVTRGKPEFQRVKLQSSGILEMVDGVFIVEEGSKNIGSIDLLVDDVEEELERFDGVTVLAEGDDFGKIVEKIIEIQGKAVENK